jgi:hypothetical protein
LEGSQASPSHPSDRVVMLVISSCLGHDTRDFDSLN